MKLRMLSAGVAACGLLLAAPASAQGVKIGILNDQSGVYADYGGKWSFEAAKILRRHLGRLERPFAAVIGIDAGLIVQNADLDALRRRRSCEQNNVCRKASRQ